MATVTGTLNNLGLLAFSAADGASIAFILSTAAATSDLRVIATRPVEVTPDPVTGQFSVNLAATDKMTPLAWYDVVITWLDSDGGYVGQDRFTKVAVPSDGGDLATLIAMSPGWLSVFYQATEPDPWPIGATWVNTATGDIERRIA